MTAPFCDRLMKVREVQERVPAFRLHPLWTRFFLPAKRGSIKPDDVPQPRMFRKRFRAPTFQVFS